MKRYLRLLCSLSGLCFGLCLSLILALPAWAGVVVVAHPSVRKLDLATVQRIYTGKVIEVGGQAVNPVNLHAGQGTRQRFLNDYLQLTDDSYLAYWTVRRYVGKGVPPRELASVAEVIAYVQSTPGAIAYLDELDAPPALSIVLRK
jgi:ABC-type phosphate transport system substrate-binding protein